MRENVGRNPQPDAIPPHKSVREKDSVAATKDRQRSGRWAAFACSGEGSSLKPGAAIRPWRDKQSNGKLIVKEAGGDKPVARLRRAANAFRERRSYSTISSL
jgi:hypothetical protein